MSGPLPDPRSRALTLVLLASLHASGCGQAPAAPDVAPPADVATGDLPDTFPAEPAACTSDLDCAPYAGCCLDVACRGGECIPLYVPDCCAEPGPCAVDNPLHRGLCEDPCTRFGCTHGLALGTDGCGGAPWSLSLDLEALATLRFDPAPGAARTAWHLSPLRPFDGHPALRAGDVLCPTFHGGPHDATCTPLGLDIPTRLAFETPAIALPADLPTIADLVVWLDLGPGALTTEAIAFLELQALDDTQATTVLWSSRPPTGTDERPSTALPQRTWTPLLVDLSPLAGRNVRLRVIFDSVDGRDRSHEGPSIGQFRVRTVCLDDLARLPASPCTLPAAAPVYPTSTRLEVSLPPSDAHVDACRPCAAATDCQPRDRCDLPRCESGRCRPSSTSSCCDLAPTWPFAPTFGGLDVTGLWRASPTALDYGLPDGSGLAPTGEPSEGEARTAPVTLPSAPVWAFDLMLSTEWDTAPSASNPAGLDLLEALVWLDPFPALPPAVVWTSTSLGGTTAGRTRRVAIDLAPWRDRTVRLGWRFQTGDAEANTPGFVRLTAPTLRNACPGCSAADEAEGRCAPISDGLLPP